MAYIVESLQYIMNQNPERLTQDKIYAGLLRYKWTTQGKNHINYFAATILGISKYLVQIGASDVSLFVERKSECSGECTVHQEVLAITEFPISEILCFQKLQSIKL